MNLDIEFDIIFTEEIMKRKSKHKLDIIEHNGDDYVVVKNKSGYYAVKLQQDKRRKAGIKAVENFKPDLDLHKKVLA